MNAWPALAWALCAGLCAAGCGQARVAGPGAPGAGELPEWLALERLPSWRMVGKLGWRVGAKGGGARVDWHQLSRTVYRIRFSGPMGQGAVLSGDSLSAKLRLGDRVDVYRGEPSALLSERLGIDGLPVHRLWSWLVCMPDRGAPYDDGDLVGGGGGAMRRFVQSGWRVRCEGHRPTDGFLLPGRITLERGDTRFLVVAKRWRLRVRAG